MYWVIWMGTTYYNEVFMSEGLAWLVASAIGQHCIPESVDSLDKALSMIRGM